MFVDIYAVGIHRPVIVGGIEDVGSRQTQCQGVLHKGFANRGIHGQPCTTETVSVHVAGTLTAHIGSDGPAVGQCKRVVKII